MEFPTGDEGYQMNYEGPYVPTERRVTYPGQDRTSTSEYQYFTPSNPIPYAEGGEVDYNFKPEYRPASGFMPSTGSKGGMTPSTERMGSPTGGLAERMGSPTGGLADDSAFRALQGMSPAFGMLGGNAQLPATSRPQPSAPIRYAEPRYSFDKLGGYTTPPSSGKGGMPPVVGRPAQDPFAPTFGTVGTSPGNAMPLGPSSGVPANQFWKTTFSPAQKFAEGGDVNMEDGGFVMDARSVSEIGNGSSNAGLEKLSKLGARPLQGRGDGVSDSIPANIGGSQKARVARDEAYFSPAAVEKLGGSQKLYAMMDKAHKSRKNAKRGQDTGGLKALMA